MGARKKLSLTEERAETIRRAASEWLSVGLSTEPADFDAAEAAIASLYEGVGRKRPYFVRLSSPLAAEIYIHLLCKTWPEPANGAQLGAQLRAQLGAQLRAQLGDQLRAQLRDQLWAQLRAQLGDQLRAQLRDQLRDQLRAQLWAQLWDQLGAQLWAQLWDQLGDQLGDQLRDQLRAQLGDQLRAQLWAQLWDQLGAQLRDQLGDQKLRYMGTCFWGSQDAYLWGWAAVGREVGASYPAALDAALDNHLVITRSIGWWYPFADFCILTDRPETIRRDDQNRLHNDAGPALRYRDGYALHAVHGVRIPAWVIEQHDLLTVAAIDAEANAEVRRVMMERYGFARFLRDAGAKRIDHDERWGTLYRREIDDDEPLVMVEVINRSPEPDGSFRHYTLRVPPTCQTALEAVAWTFEMAPAEYAQVGAET